MTDLIARNATFAAERFAPGLRMLPSTRTLLIGCVDPRVDPAHVLGIALGEAAIIRNVGGRVTPGVLAELALLADVSRAAGGELGPGWDLVVLQHTDCGITRLGGEPLARFLGVDLAGLEAKAHRDPRAAVAADVEALRAAPGLSGAFTVTGLVYDVATGAVEVVVPAAPLRPE